MSIVFGPVKSRRFGESLGVDLSPGIKQCNYDCLYCELEGKKAIDNMTNIVEVDDILNEISMALRRFRNIDSITITANGEPTMYPNLYELMLRLEDIKGDCKTLLLSNGSLLWDINVSRACLLFDKVKFSLDAVSENIFKKIDRPNKGISLDRILSGIYDFCRDFSGELYAEILFVKSVNDSMDEVVKMARYLSGMNLARLDIGTIDRPPAYKVHGVDYKALCEFAAVFRSYNIRVHIPTRDSEIDKKLDIVLDRDEILKLLSLRPLSTEEVNVRFSNETILIINELVKEGLISLKDSGGISFYEI